MPPEENLQDEAVVKDLLVSDENLAKHTAHADRSVTHDQVRKALAKLPGSFVDDIRLCAAAAKEGFELADLES
ncbi:MAG: hypothetical protein O3C40_33325 [Planctomycetota bacterium]|nr:hypothetical protein [Planctomycetota bacterium]